MKQRGGMTQFNCGSCNEAALGKGLTPARQSFSHLQSNSLYAWLNSHCFTHVNKAAAELAAHLLRMA